ncbi:hypothetical protein GYMLUDRAFT_251941 [Collybiopsis luxurians FD-317 M1]|uniref:Uncharacterized protein n=1 Tax=Collybiopsis luxurians FD-317 M1 TaxID=944289 RepID=A0A0D0CA07_9AGAR|nr:hypothetical protein GYMLUDRAFT_251941 [Collybiopsis luxurians FD-317 M1]
MSNVNSDWAQSALEEFEVRSQKLELRSQSRNSKVKVGSQKSKSEVRSRSRKSKVEVGTRKSEVGSRKSDHREKNFDSYSAGTNLPLLPSN